MHGAASTQGLGAGDGSTKYIVFMSSMKMVEEEKKVAVLERKAVADALKEEEAQNRVPQVGSYKSSGVGAA